MIAGDIFIIIYKKDRIVLLESVELLIVIILLPINLLRKLRLTLLIPII